MSMLKLLTAGKSLVGMPDTTSRYRMRSKNPMPKFGSSKNPFAPPPKPEPVVEADEPAPAKLKTGSLFDPEPEEQPAPREIKANLPEPAAPVKAEIKVVENPRPEKAAPTPVPAPAIKMAEGEKKRAGGNLFADPTQKPKVAVAVARSGSWFDWVKHLNPISLWSERKAGPGGRGKAMRSQVQTELSLEKVRVVRNDLSETDLEIVPGRRAVRVDGASQVAALVTRPETGAWNRLTARFLQPEKIQQ